jgi:hypothetical protein
LLPLIEFESRVTDPDLRDRVRAIREDTLETVEEGQSDWHAWTWRNARRLALAEAALGANPAHSTPAAWGRNCDGSQVAEPEQPAAPADEGNTSGADSNASEPAPETRP